MKTEKIIPAIMPQSFQEIEEYALFVRQVVTSVQLDLMDGKYVPEKTWPFYHQADVFLDALKKGKEGFPFWKELDYELDLMVVRPEEKLETWMKLGASRVIFHYASVHDWEKIKRIDESLRNFTQLGLALTIHDDLETAFPLLEEKVFDFVQVMGIAHIGYMGEPFEEKSLTLIKKIKEKFPQLSISVDGGVSETTLPLLREAGAERFVSGSYVFHHGIPQENVQFLDHLAQSLERE